MSDVTKIAEANCAAWRDRAQRAEAERDRLLAEINTAVVGDFLVGVRNEATHQRVRWGVDHDGGKTDADWFWLVGYLVGKALHKPEKRLHHLITAAAALFNWHLATIGRNPNMRPGIEPPAEPSLPMLLHCPECGLQHVDEGEWATKPHGEHLCTRVNGAGVDEGCGHKWRPAPVRTVGVLSLPEAA